MFQEKLGDEQRMAQDQAAADARLADLEGQVRQVRKCGKCGRCAHKGLGQGTVASSAHPSVPYLPTCPHVQDHLAFFTTPFRAVLSVSE